MGRGGRNGCRAKSESARRGATSTPYFRGYQAGYLGQVSLSSLMLHYPTWYALAGQCLSRAVCSRVLCGGWDKALPIERINAGHLQQHGRHERMHPTSRVKLPSADEARGEVPGSSAAQDMLEFSPNREHDD